jgi:hypothetical protein
MTDLLDDFATWRLSTFHAPECVRHLEDPGNRCICRPPMAAEPKKPAPHEIERSRREDDR